MDTVTGDTKTTIGIAVVVLFAAVGGVWWLAALLADIRAQLKTLGERAEEAMTIERAVEVALRTAMANPGLRVADPRNPGEFFYIENGGSE